MAPRSSGAALLSLAGAAAGLAAAVVLASSSRSTAPRVRRARTRLRTLWLLARHNPAALAGGAASGPLEVPPQLYPAVRRDESVSDTYHGTVIKDPYRWRDRAPLAFRLGMHVHASQRLELARASPRRASTGWRTPTRLRRKLVRRPRPLSRAPARSRCSGVNSRRRRRRRRYSCRRPERAEQLRAGPVRHANSLPARLCHPPSAAALRLSPPTAPAPATRACVWIPDAHRAGSG